MIFEYDAAIAYSRSVSGIEDFARDLLGKLRGIRLDRLKVRCFTDNLQIIFAIYILILTDKRNRPDQLFLYATV